MHGCMSRKTFQTSRHIDQIMNIVLLCICFFQLRIHIQCFINRDVQFLRDHFSNGIHLCIRHIQYTPHITDHTTGSQCTECNDLYDTVITILTAHIINDFLSSFETEVNVNIRHGNSLRIQESFKQKIITNRVKLRDPKGIGNQTSRCGTTSRTYHNLMVTGIFDKIPHNQEVIYISHIFDRR